MFTKEKIFIYSEIICNKNAFRSKANINDNNNKANNKKEEKKSKEVKSIYTIKVQVTFFYLGFVYIYIFFLFTKYFIFLPDHINLTNFR